MDLLAIESFYWTPHLETSIEICVNASKESNVGICMLNVDNSDDANVRYPLLGLFGKAHKRRQVKRLLKNTNINVINTPDLSRREMEQVKEFTNISLQSFEELMCLQFEGVNLGFGVASSLIDKLRKEKPSIKDCEENGLRKYLHDAAATHLVSIKLINKFKPAAILTFNGRFANSRAIVLAARKSDTPVFYHEISDHQERYTLSDKTPHDYEAWRSNILNVWNNREDEDASNAIAEQYYLKRINGQFNEKVNHLKSQIKGRLPVLLDKRRVVFFSQSDEEYAAVEGLTHPIFTNQRDCIQWLIKFYECRDDIQFLIRLHPNLLNKSKDDYDWWHSLRGKNLQLIESSSPVDSYLLIQNVDLILTYCSASVGIEATFLGKPSIIMGDSLFRSTDAAYHPSSLEEIVNLLNQPELPPKDKKNTFPYAFFRETHGIPFRLYHPKTRYSGTISGVRLANYPWTK